jgi:hypothetical protein
VIIREIPLEIRCECFANIEKLIRFPFDINKPRSESLDHYCPKCQDDDEDCNCSTFDCWKRPGEKKLKNFCAARHSSEGLLKETFELEMEKCFSLRDKIH